MKFKVFMRKVNRGLVFGLVVAIVFIFYVIIDTAAFESKKPELQDMVKTYFNDISALCITPEEYRDIDETSSEAYKAELNSKAKEIINNYWIDSTSNTEYYIIDKSAFLENILSLADNTDGYVSDWACNVTDIEVLKSGPSIVTINYSVKVTATYCGDTNILIGSQAAWCSYAEMYGMMDSDYTKDDDFKATFNIDETMSLAKADGEWKISSISSYGYQNDIISSEDMEVTE